MDLPYPTFKNNDVKEELNQLDKLARSILLSTHDIPCQEVLQKNIKTKILRAITCDNARKLHKILDKEVVPFTTEIGTKGSRWNILHFCAKSNAYQCVEFILKTQYQESPQDYKKVINSKTVEGFTMVTISIINRSQKVLESILDLGGIDIHVLDEHKMSPYEIALNYKNDSAIRLLMSYESKTKKKDFINKEALNLPLQFPSETLCQKATFCFLSCLTFGFYDHDDGFEFKEENIMKVSEAAFDEEFVDYVPINSKKDLQGYDIEWKRIHDLMDSNSSLYSSYNPFEIRETNFTLQNNLIFLQSLSQQPWLIRRAIKADRCRNNHYNVMLYPNRMLDNQNIDDYIPVIKERKEAMFLFNRQEMWPMLLQKALAKRHSSYFSLAHIDPFTLIEEVSGFPTVEFKIIDIVDEEIISFLQNIVSKNYLYLLKGKEGGDLCDQKDKTECFTILNFYEKDDQQLVLINCPFVSEKWKKKEDNEILQLKLLKTYYNTHNQMLVWIEAKKLKEYFESIIISLTFPNTERTELKIKTKEFVFFKFRIEKPREENVYFELSNPKTNKVYNLSNLQIIKDEGKELIQLCNTDIKLLNQDIAQIEFSEGEYMCMYQIHNESLQIQSLLLLCWSPELLQTEVVEPELGILEWLGFLKNQFLKVKEQCVLESLGDFSLVLFRERTSNIVLLRLNVENEEIIEGKKDEETGFIEMINEGQIHYCVLKKAVKADEIAFDSKAKV